MSLITILWLTGCGTIIIDAPDNPEYAPINPRRVPVLPPQLGSIYSQQPIITQAQVISLYEDIKAHNVGDLITVFLKEKTDASKDLENKYEKKTEDTFPDPTLFGTSAKWRTPKQFPTPLVTGQNLNLDMSISNDLKFDSTANSTQKNKLVGTITVTVTDVYPNGNLAVRGEKWIRINDGDEFVRIKGIIRPEDVGPDNTIDSNRIANARITYSGRGTFADSNKPGWLIRLITSQFWPI